MIFRVCHLFMNDLEFLRFGVVAFGSLYTHDTYPIQYSITSIQ